MNWARVCGRFCSETSRVTAVHGLCGLALPAVVSGEGANGVRAKFRNGVVRFGEMVLLNFDLTPFASFASFA
jgi:hypothetical protein